MNTPKPFQVSVVQRLYPHRNTVNAGLSEGGKAIGLNRAWVRFKGNFQVISCWPKAPDCGDDVRDDVRVHQAWGAAAEKDSVQHTSLGFGRAAFQL